MILLEIHKCYARLKPFNNFFTVTPFIYLYKKAFSSTSQKAVLVSPRIYDRTYRTQQVITRSIYIIIYADITLDQISLSALFTVNK